MPDKNTIENISSQSAQEEAKPKSNQIEIPSISLPKGGGAIKSIDDKFQVNPADGTAGFSVPFPFSPSRNSFMPGMTLSYNSGSGNGVFGLGWNAEPPSIARKTEKKLPEYNDAEESDTFIFSGAEDLVPSLKKGDTGNWIKDESPDGLIKRYRPRTEGGFARIEKITEADGNVYWKVTSKDNIKSIFGKSKSARISNPDNETKIFKWLLEFSYDDKGNCFQLEYKKEDKINVSNVLPERNRLNDYSKFTNTYLKRIKYCSKESYINNNNPDYLLELVLDYGEHDLVNPQPDDDNGWVCRQDAFSDYRAGFEIRTYRLCQRVLMFHHFPAELKVESCLVRSMDFMYDSGTAFTFLQSITQKGFTRKADGTYTKEDGPYSGKSLPPVTFTYEQLGWNTAVKSLPKESLENLPVGIDDQSYQWIDLYSEGLSGILTEQANGWYYKRNSGDGNFDAMKLVSPKPSFNGLSVGAVHFQDVEANGQKFLVSNDMNGYCEFTPEEEWLPFKTFNEVPNIDLRDPNLKFLDLNGDGKADMLITQDDVFMWYASKGKEGFESYQTVRKTIDEEKGPNIVFADSTQSIVLSDMSGDGLMDIVRIRNSEIVYWPNLGYGKFGAKVSMGNAPWFDKPDHFNPKYVKLADLDGSGTTDVVYIGKDSFKIYFNQSGNSWSEQNIVKGVNPIPFSKVDDYANVSIIDLTGNGTGCIVWSSALPAYTANPLRYIDLMNGLKPHIMIGYKNNMGKEVSIEYKPSTWFYLQDKEAGTPWVTKLPFPVHCVSQVATIDQIRKSRFTNKYTYHHGYYDYAEREFRGFGRVDQTDTEDYENYKKNANPDGSFQIVDEGFHEPPVLTKTWFHTGAFIAKEKILNQFAHEYYQNASVPENVLAEPALPGNLTIDEWREALRACKGMPLHVEVYSMDGSDKQDHPYTTAQHTCLIQLLQPKLNNEHAIFMVMESKALTYTYERNPADPRISHNMNIEVNEYGNVLKAAAISYGRKTIDADLTENEQTEQSKTHIVFTENNFSNTIDNDADYRLPLLCESKTYELTSLSPSSGDYFKISEIKDDYDNAETIAYEDLPDISKSQKRLIEHVRSLFFKNDLSAALALGEMESLGIPYQSYKLSLTPALVQDIFDDKVDQDLLINDGRYFQFAGDANYWIASGTQKYDAGNFYQVIEVQDPFGYTAQISYDAAYHLYVKKTTDALGNSPEILGFSFRTLSPYLMKDINDNRSAIRIDELGVVMSTFVMGKESENKGDLFDTSSVEASDADKPGSTLIYDLFQYINNNGKPNYIKTTVNETDYFYSVEKSLQIVTQTSYTYYCGAGKEVMRKVQAEPGIALQENEDGSVTPVDTTPNLRWIGNGRTLINNKGKPVKQYEPYFSVTPDYEAAEQLVERGVTVTISYDSLGRVIRTDYPDGTFAKVEFDAWKQLSFDQNDTVLESEWYEKRINPSPQDTEDFINENKDPAKEKEAAQKAAAHANTPTVTYLDSLGRNFISIADNASNGKNKTITETDIEGSLKKITDARGNAVMQYKYDMLGNQLYSLSMDAGERWIINDVMGKPMKSWDSRNHIFRYEYDRLHRPLNSFVATGSAAEINFGKIVYGDMFGEDAENNKALNLRGKAYQQFDAAGIVTNIEYDFKGNLLQSSRQLCSDYKNDIDWNASSEMEEETFVSSTEYDALNRPIIITAPDSSIITPAYNEAALLESISVKLKGTADTTVFVKVINYNEKAQRESIIYGNDTKTNYKYDTNTFRLIQLITNRKDDTGSVQKLSYTYDAVGNITYIKDEAQQTIFFDNTIVEPSCDYVYDAVYQLIQATGREHIGQNQLPQDNWKDEYFTNLVHKGDGNAMRNYTQSFLYDAVGNIMQLKHAANGGSYTRDYEYETANNRIINTKIGDNTFAYAHDVHGNINVMPHLALMQWNFKDQLHCAQQTVASDGSGDKTYYVYDGSGQRIRKITAGKTNKKEERIYLGGFEIYRSYNNDGTLSLERETLHIVDDKTKVGLLETKTIDNGSNDKTTLHQPYIRYQFTNHLGSACLELNENAEIISYEEYHPYGTTAYQAMNASINAVAKRYRYTGMERDEESGFEYHSARYYFPLLGRWLSGDPIGIDDGLNLFTYCKNNALKNVDINGKDCWDSSCSTDDADAGTSSESDYDQQNPVIPLYKEPVYGPPTPAGHYPEPPRPEQQVSTIADTDPNALHLDPDGHIVCDNYCLAEYEVHDNDDKHENQDDDNLESDENTTEKFILVTDVVEQNTEHGGDLSGAAGVVSNLANALVAGLKLKDFIKKPSGEGFGGLVWHFSKWGLTLVAPEIGLPVQAGSMLAEFMASHTTQ